MKNSSTKNGKMTYGKVKARPSSSVTATRKSKAPSQKGALKTSMTMDVKGGAPKRATSQGGQLVGGMPPTFGVGKSANAKSRTKASRGPGRKTMY